MPPQVIREGTIEEQHIAMMPDGCGNKVELNRYLKSGCSQVQSPLKAVVPP